MNLLLLDNFDSFTFNIAHYIEALTGNVPDVVRNDVVEPSKCIHYDGIILSPGPGLPDEAGRMQQVIRAAQGEVPILGICLGMQGIAIHNACDLKNLGNVRHGISTLIHINDPDDPMFSEIMNPFRAGSYHSWVVDETSIPSDIKVTATDSEGNVMAISHTIHPVYGIQTHPESIMTDAGMRYIQNFLDIIGKYSMS